MSQELTAIISGTRVRLSVRTPKYRKHSTKDFGFIEVDGKRHRLPGRWNSAESTAAYHEIVAKIKRSTLNPAATKIVSDSTMTVASLCASYMLHCKHHYGESARGEYRNNGDAILHLIRGFGHVRVVDFTPKSMRAFQQQLALTPKMKRTKAGLITSGQTISRKYINSLVERIRRMFSWAVGEELVSGSQFFALKQVKALRKGRSGARETAKRKPVPLKYVKPVLPYVSWLVRAMLRVQVYTGARSDSICNAKPEQFDTSGKLWLWRPKHKTEYRDAEVVLPIGPRCQRILKPIIESTLPGEYLFDPRKTRKNKRYNARYTSLTYCRAVVRGINNANKARPADDQIPHWTPHLIRHYKGDAVDAKYGLEAAQAVLAHDNISATKIYRRRRLDLAKRVAKETG